jgi:pseudouridine-5'-phosphate glycosidase
MPAPMEISPAVRDALASGRPVVALETAVLTHGLPRAPLAAAPACTGPAGAFAGRWEAALPANIALSALLEAVVRRGGAEPATVGMIDGVLHVGLTPAQRDRLGADTQARKLSTRDLGPAAAQGASGGTTVAATLAACALAGIRVFATGGIGGVHRGWTQRPDVSADLAALARTPTAVISAGAKSILDLPATVEALDALGVPVLGVGTPWFPRFLSEGAAPLRVSATVRDAAEAAAACRAHWSFAPACGVLVANPPPAAHAIPTAQIEAVIEAALAEAHRAGIAGPETTPFLLDRVQRATAGRSVDANIAVLADNARLGAELAAHLRAAATAPKA